MRYFKYKNTAKNYNNALKEQYKTLTKDEKEIVRKERTWLRLTSIISPGIFCIVCMWGIILLKRIPRPDNLFWIIIYYAGMLLLGFFVLIVSGLLTYVMSIPLFKKIDSFNVPLMKKDIFSKACAHLREYYGLNEPYIVTKCYDSSDELFRNHDVCIFVVEDELRITADLVRGFLYGERDLGCYCFRRDEISLTKKKDGNILVAELRCGDTSFSLGYRAKSYIEKYFFNEYTLI
ncbi:MAG: hypothetical protein IKM61_07015 [Eubacteriaceae bacterium]|nr:hypothetical protein [Eubacteriaceae bacterium]